MNVSEVTTIADLFILCSGRGERQVQAISDGIVERAKAAGRMPVGVEGYGEGRWILIDLGDVIVHAFVPEERDGRAQDRIASVCGRGRTAAAMTRCAGVSPGARAFGVTPTSATKRAHSRSPR